MRHRYFRLLAVLLAVAGYWAPWLTHPAAALRLNGYELSEWVTFLPGVRDGSLPISRLLFLLPLACLALLCALVASRLPSAPALPPLGQAPPEQPPRRGLASALPALMPKWGWLLVLLGAVLAFVVFPPYPYLLTAYADQEYQGQFFVAGLTTLALVAILYLPLELKDGLQALLAVIGLGAALWGLLALEPIASALLHAPWLLGLGFVVMLAGFFGLALAGLAQLFGPRV